MDYGEAAERNVPRTDESSVEESVDTEKSSTSEPTGDSEAITPIYTTGWRLSIMILCASLCMFLVNMEVSIVGTSLVSITNDLHDFKQMGWVVTGYLITYTGLLIIWSKISDIYGRKPVMIASLLIFTIFSGACGAAQTMIQLILFRAFQGIGAAGSVSMAMITAYEMVPKEKYPSQAAKMSGAIAFGSLVGPLIGGGVSQKSTWRWIFLINVPAGLITAFLTLIAVPKNFPHHQTQQTAPSSHQRQRKKFSKENLYRLDLLGAFLLFGATLILVTALLEAGTEFSWGSGTAISLLVISALLLVLFLLNERTVTSDRWKQEPIFPWHFLFNRAWMGTLLLSFLSGIPYNIIVVDLPQRFQAIDNIDPFGAGVRLIPFNFSMSLGSVLINIIAGKSRIPPIFLLFSASIVQLIGLSLFSTLSEDGLLHSAIYGYEVVAGLGIGSVMGMLLQMPPAVVEKRDLAISGGALLQFRVLGGALGLAIASTVMNNYLSSHLGPLIGAENLALILKSTSEIQTLPAEFQVDTVDALAHGYNLQMKVNIGFSVVQVLAVGLLWRRKQIEVVEPKVKVTS